MPYLVVEDFSAGWDLRKSAVTAPAGTLRTLKDGFVNAGGEIEKRQAFVSRWTLPAGTIGLAPFDSTPYVFGAGTTPGGLPSGVGYQQLVGLTDPLRFRDSTVFSEKIFVTIQRTLAAPNDDQYFYDGVEVLTTYNALFPVRVFRSKVFLNGVRYCVFSALNDPSTLGSGTGGGVIELDTYGEGDWVSAGLEVYYDQLALFGRTAIQLWNMDEDPAKSALVQTLGNIGCIAPHGVTRYGAGDVLFVAQSGIRSLRARDSSNAAVSTDIGSPLDEVIRPLVRQMTLSQRAVIRALVEPLTGNVWFVFPPVGANPARAFILAAIPGSRISAWSEFSVPSDAELIPRVVNNRVMIRAGDTIHVYGGNGTTPTYDSTVCEVVTPMMDTGTPATQKLWTGLDLAVEGTWTVDVGTDPTQPTLFERVATVTGPTFSMQNLGLHNRGTHIALRLRTTGSTRARVGKIVLHYQPEPSE